MHTLDFTDRHVVVTGGTGALGAAVVQLLIEAGAICHIPAHRSPEGMVHERIHIESKIDLTDEAAVGKFYDSLPSLWASIHTAGGFAAGKIGDTSLQTWKQMHETNGLTCFLCCREAIRKIRSTNERGTDCECRGKARADSGRGIVGLRCEQSGRGFADR